MKLSMEFVSLFMSLLTLTSVSPLKKHINVLVSSSFLVGKTKQKKQIKFHHSGSKPVLVSQQDPDFVHLPLK